MNKFVKYPSIESFKNFMKTLNRRVPDYCEKVSLYGITKVHGTNAGIGFWKDGTITSQSRNRILSVGNDNAGFANWVKTTITQDHWQSLINSVNEQLEFFTDSCDYDGVIVFGEWCGENIQKGVAVTGMEKHFLIFDVGLVKLGREGEEPTLNFGQLSEFVVDDIVNSVPNVRMMHEFGMFKIENVNPWDKQPLIDEVDSYTALVDANCPVGTALNESRSNNIGEGIIWEVFNSDTGEYYGEFKAKGESHKRGGESGVKKFEVEQNVITNPRVKEVLDDALTVDRLLQGIEYLNEMNLPNDRSSTGHYLKWVCQDVLKEYELDIAQLFIEEGIEWKSISKHVSGIAKEFFFKQH